MEAYYVRTSPAADRPATGAFLSERIPENTVTPPHTHMNALMRTDSLSGVSFLGHFGLQRTWGRCRGDRCNLTRRVHWDETRNFFYPPPPPAVPWLLEGFSWVGVKAAHTIWQLDSDSKCVHVCVQVCVCVPGTGGLSNSTSEQGFAGLSCGWLTLHALA